MGNSRGAMEMVSDAKETIDNLSVDDVAAELESGDALLVDLREPGELEKVGTIEGAIHAPRGMLEFYADPATPYHMDELDPARRIILHCASGGRSALAVKTLQEMGFTDVANLGGGMKAWIEAGMPVIGGEA